VIALEAPEIRFSKSLPGCSMRGRSFTSMNMLMQ